MIGDDRVIEIPDGIPGFPLSRRFLLVELVEDGAFSLLRSLDEQVEMVVCDPWQFFPDYAPHLNDIEEHELGIASADEAVVFCPVTLDPDNSRIHVNLLGPFVVNASTRQGRQLVLANDIYPSRGTVELEYD